MADDKKKKSADEIVDELAEDMGVDDDEQVAASDESAEDVMGDLGGIFGVSSKKKKKKKKSGDDETSEKEESAEPVEEADSADPVEPDSAADELEDEDEPEAQAEEVEDDVESDEADEEPAPVAKEPAESKKTKQPKKKARSKDAGIDGIFTPGDQPDEDDSYLTSEDLGDIDPPMQGSSKGWIIGFVVLLAVVGGGILIYAGPGDVMAVLRGDYRERKQAEKERIEEEFAAEQDAKRNKFGDLMINGNPQYSLVKIDGKPWYGQTSSGWRAFRIGSATPVQNLNIKNPLSIEVSAPGFQPFTEQLTEAKWEESSAGGSFSKVLSANLVPLSEAHKLEFDARIAPDVDTDYFGTITLNSNPPGALINFNNKALLDKDGEPMVTPVTFDKYWAKDEETGKLEEKQVNVDTTIDIGHKIELFMDYPNQCAEGASKCVDDDGCCPDVPECTVATDNDCKFPRFVMSLQRQMWTCTFDEPKKEKAMESGESLQSACTYTFDYTADLNGLAQYIREREAELQRVMAQRKAAGEDPDAGADEEAAE